MVTLADLDPALLASNCACGPSNCAGDAGASAGVVGGLDKLAAAEGLDEKLDDLSGVSLTYLPTYLLTY